MQDIKKREIEYVRYRAVAVHSGSAEPKALLEAMRSSARAVLSEFESGADLNDLPWPPSSASGGSQEFLRDANERAPCRWTDEFEWHRTGMAVSAGGRCGLEAAEELQVARLCEWSPVSDSERSGGEEDFAVRAAFRAAYAWPRWECHRS